MIHAARELKEIETSIFFRSMVEVAAVPAQNKKYSDALIEYYQKRAERFDDRPKEKSGVMPWELATQIMAERLALKTRLDSGGQ